MPMRILANARRHGQTFVAERLVSSMFIKEPDSCAVLDATICLKSLEPRSGPQVVQK